MKSKILIIDDEEKLRQLLARLLKLEDFNIYEAANLKSASQILDKENIEVVLCDVKLPDGNGVDFVSEVKKKYPLIPPPFLFPSVSENLSSDSISFLSSESILDGLTFTF